jgi:hypothetical protein
MERIALTIIEACQVAGISRTSLYAAIGRGELAEKWASDAGASRRPKGVDQLAPPSWSDKARCSA